METATIESIEDWILIKGYVVGVYPRRGEVVVNGFKHYKADKRVCDAAKQAYKTKLSVK